MVWPLEPTLRRNEAVPCTSRLVIRAVAPAPRPPPASSLVARLQVWYARAHSASASPAGRLSLRVLDMKGRQVFAAEHAEAVTVVALPAGTYHVLARSPDTERRYTLALDPKQSVDLYVRTT